MKGRVTRMQNKLCYDHVECLRDTLGLALRGIGHWEGHGLKTDIWRAAIGGI